MTIGEKIKHLREKNNMTQTDIAKQIGIATQTIFKYEKNIVTNIPLDNIEKLASIFRVSPAYLMGWNDVPMEGLGDNSVTNHTEQLTSNEQNLLNLYRKLNTAGKAKTKTYINDLLAIPSYNIKHAANNSREANYKIAAWGGKDTEGDDQPPIEEITT